jgi:hypothetical protein
MRQHRPVPYRTLPNGEPEITIVNLGSNFWLRLRTHLGARKWTLAALAVGGAVISVPIAGVVMLMMASRAEEIEPLFLHMLARTLPFVIAFLVAPMLVVIVVTSLTPNDMERLLPRGLVLRETSIDVLTRSGDRQAERWSYLAEAVETADAFQLVLQRDPRLFLVLAKSRLGSNDATRLRRWLIAHRCMRA